MATIQEIRAQYPQYKDMSDLDLANALYRKHYSDMPRAEFDQKIGVPSPGVVADPQFQQQMQGAGGKHQELWNPTAQQRYDRAATKVREYYPPMSDEEWARFSAEAELTPYDSGDLAREGLMFGLQGETRALSGASAAALTGKDFGQAWQDYNTLADAQAALGKEQSGLMGGVAELAGGLTGGGAPNLVANALSRGAPTAVKVAQGVSDAAAQGALYGLGATEGDLANRAQGALTTATFAAPAGGLAAGATSSIGNILAKGAQKKAVNAAIKGAPGAKDLAQAGSALFQQVDAAGAAVKPGVFKQFADDIATKARADRINPTLDPKATGAMQELASLADEAAQANRGLTLSEIHNMRQIAQKAAVSSEGRDAMFAQRIIDGLDNMISGLKPADMIGGQGAKVGNLLMEGISTWGRAKRVSLIEEAMYKAQNQASGLENGLRTQFRAILQNPTKRRLFNADEIAAIEKVANGSGLSNITRLLGMFGFDFGSGRNMLGGAAGFMLGGIPGAVGGALARKASERLTMNSADRAARIVATPNIPQLTALPKLPGRVLGGRAGAATGTLLN